MALTTIKLTKDLTDGLAEGDVLTVDGLSAAALIERGDATEHTPGAASETDAEATIDDIEDPEVARNRRVMAFKTVAAPDPGPGTNVKPAQTAPAHAKRGTGPKLAASDAKSAGGDAGGGDSK